MRRSGLNVCEQKGRAYPFTMPSGHVFLVRQSLAILLWAFSTLRHEHAGLMEALAHRGLQLLQDPQEHSLLTKSILTMTIWVRAALTLSIPAHTATPVHESTRMHTTGMLAIHRKVVCSCLQPLSLLIELAVWCATVF